MRKEAFVVYCISATMLRDGLAGKQEKEGRKTGRKGISSSWLECYYIHNGDQNANTYIHNGARFRFFCRDFCWSPLCKTKYFHNLKMNNALLNSSNHCQYSSQRDREQMYLLAEVDERNGISRKKVTRPQQTIMGPSSTLLVSSGDL